jgi:uncharacterized protein YjbJ (UPF0337 family)
MNKGAVMVVVKRAKNSADHAKGKLKEIVGEAAGNDELRDEGKDDQSVANLRQAAEKVKNAFRK